MAIKKVVKGNDCTEMYDKTKKLFNDMNRFFTDLMIEVGNADPEKGFDFDAMTSMEDNDILKIIKGYKLFKELEDLTLSMAKSQDKQITMLEMIMDDVSDIKISMEKSDKK